MVPEAIRDLSCGLELEGGNIWDMDNNENDISTQGQITFGIMHSKDGDLMVEYKGDDDDIIRDDEDET